MTNIAPCHSCGAPTNLGGRYCKQCGAPTAPPPVYAPPQAPAPGAPSTRSWPAIVGAATAFVLVACAIVAVVLTSAGGGSAVHAATVLTVTAPQAATPTGSVSGTGENPSPSRSGATGSHLATGETPALSLVAYHGAEISAEIPAGWITLENEAHKTGYIESKWSNPADSNDTVLIDTSPATQDTLEQDAAPVHDALLASSGYQQLSYGPGNLTGVESWMWVFRISGDQRVDYFFNRCSSGYAVLGSTVPGRFNRLTGTFRTVAQSVQPANPTPPC